jgi:hypothetical protein
MTSDVKRWPQRFLGLQAIFAPVSIGRGGARQRRRVILRLAVGWVLPDWPPSGAGLTRGTSIPVGRVTPSRVTPYRAGASAKGCGPPAARLRPQSCVSRVSGVIAPGFAMAHMHATTSRAMAPTTWLAGCPRAITWRSRCHRRTGALQLRSWRGLGRCSRHRWSGRLTVAGSREAHAPAMRARRAWRWPVLVMGP